MVTPSYLKTLHPHQDFSTKSPSSTSSSTTNIENLVHALILSHVYRIFRALSKAKSALTEILKENQPKNLFIYTTKTAKKKRKKYPKKVFSGSFRLHYNWCSSHVLPLPETVIENLSPPYLYHDSSWNPVITTEQQSEDKAESQLSGYLHWLEQKVHENANGNHREDVNEIDRLADMFIASCHEKFRLEKQESYRRFQEMMARSM